MRTITILAASALTLGAANAADFVAPPPVAVAAYNWTGLYVGAHLGGAWSSTTATAANRAVIIAVYGGLPAPRGIVGGVQIGYRVQMPNNIVLGVEASGGVGPGFSDTVSIPGVSSLKSEGRWYAMLGVNLGYAMNNWLPYIAGGVAFAGNRVTANVLGATGTFSNTHTGFYIGGGLEYALNQNWSVGVDYRYTQFGRRTYGFPSVGSRISTVLGKVNYRF